jgi:hypothetical protein
VLLGFFGGFSGLSYRNILLCVFIPLHWDFDDGLSNRIFYSV